ncbi:NAD(P)/FAD-dependent oxidoreductase [Actinoplanes sp. L3-i22]|uniref:NAD(P)/FAD-dependent oxidoreductase n=1 Tax=Actinoplanes sp. L3-i22 TaxID=2836373 RepID=UPI001C7535FB|nr:FAD-dependent oxidoreductase [Actinoplanes sp. L3-i22]BCY10661.1 ferredoxin [Actinoplanes sp. L3-i22]
MPETYVIVGASLAGAKAAETLRAEGFPGRVVLIGDDPRRPYERPPLSKGLLLGTAELDSPFVHDADWYSGRDIELRLGERVEELSLADKTLKTSQEIISYDKLLLTTGARPRRLPVEGGHYLRTYDDSAALSAVLEASRHLTIVGSGWIGLEVAAAARERGVAVTVITPDQVPLREPLGERVGALFGELHRGHDVDFRFGARVQELREKQVVLAGGAVVDTDHVLVAIGAVPNAELAERAGLAVDNGVLVDAYHRTSDPDVFAAGDVANVDHPRYGRIRVEHWANALNSGPAAARSMLGRGTPWTAVPYFFTDQYDLGMEFAGRVEPGADLVVRGDLGKLEAIVFWTVGGRVVAGMNLNVWDVTDDIQALIAADRPVDPARLADPSVPLAELG